MCLHYAPTEERFKHIIQRLIRIPELVRQAEQNLSDSPEIWNKVAREENTGNIDLIEGVLRTSCPQGFGARVHAGRRTGAHRAARIQRISRRHAGEENLRLAPRQGVLRQEIQLCAGDRQDAGRRC